MPDPAGTGGATEARNNDAQPANKQVADASSEILRDTGFTPETLPPELKGAYDNMVRGMNRKFQQTAEELKEGRDARDFVDNVHRPLMTDPVISERVEFLRLQAERAQKGLPPLPEPASRRKDGANETEESEEDLDAPLTKREAQALMAKQAESLDKQNQQRDWKKEADAAYAEHIELVGEDEYQERKRDFQRQLAKYEGSGFSPKERIRKAWTEIGGEIPGEDESAYEESPRQPMGLARGRNSGRAPTLPPPPPRGAPRSAQVDYAMRVADIKHGSNIRWR